MNEGTSPLPPHYRDTARILLRFAIVMAIVGLLSGIAYQESQKKLPLDAVDAGFRLQATLHLALVHGHILLIGTVLPVALIGMLFLARKIGGGLLGTRSVRLLTRGFLPFTTMTVALMLYKGYHFLLQARGGTEDLAAIDAGFLGGSVAARFAIYGVVHTGMGVTLGIFLILLWRSLKSAR